MASFFDSYPDYNDDDDDDDDYAYVYGPKDRPFDPWFETEVQKINQSIERNPEELSKQVSAAKAELQALWNVNNIHPFEYPMTKEALEEASRLLDDDDCPGEKVYGGETGGTAIQILLYKRIEHKLCRKAERAKVVSFWAKTEYTLEVKDKVERLRDEVKKKRRTVLTPWKNFWVGLPRLGHSKRESKTRLHKLNR